MDQEQVNKSAQEKTPISEVQAAIDVKIPHSLLHYLFKRGCRHFFIHGNIYRIEFPEGTVEYPAGEKFISMIELPTGETIQLRKYDNGYVAIRWDNPEDDGLYAPPRNINSSGS